MTKLYRKKLIDWITHILIIQIVLSTFSSIVSIRLSGHTEIIELLYPLLFLQAIALFSIFTINRFVLNEAYKLNSLYIFMVLYVLAQTFTFIDYKGYFIVLLSMTWYFSYLTIFKNYKKMLLFILVSMYLFFAFAYKSYNLTFEFSSVHLVALLNYFIISAYIAFDLKKFNDKISEETENEINELSNQLEVARQKMIYLDEENRRLDYLDEELTEKVKAFEAKNLELISEKNRFQLILDASSEVLWDLDLSNGKRSFSESKILSHPEFYNYSAEPKTWYEHVHPEEKHSMIEGHEMLLSGKTDYFSMEFRHIYQDEFQWFLCRSLSLRDEYGKVTHIAGSYSWIHPQKQKDLEIEAYAFFDSLTGFPNRSKLIKDLFDKLEQHPKQKFTIYYVDLSGFREINNTYGHHVGDEIIKSVSIRLKQHLIGFPMYRINGPEFIFLDYNESISREDMISSINDIFANPFSYLENAVHISYNIGISCYPSHGLHPEVLLKHADTALYHAKLRGLRKTCVYNEQMTDDVTTRTVISNLLYNAIKTNEFSVYFQPIYNLDKNRIYGFEALLRWFSPQIGQIPPSRFIPIAEETGVIIELGSMVIEMACSEMLNIVRKNPDIIVSVNVSAKQIVHENFIKRLNSIINEINFPKENLCIEITESVLIESFDLVVDKLNFLRNLGYTVALDDFGTGYSSLNYLSQLPISTLKIDKAFVDRIHDRSQEYFLLKSMITLASDLSLNLIVEGIETQNQKELLEQLGCHLFQGFYFSRPLDSNGLSRFVFDRNFPDIV